MVIRLRTVAIIMKRSLILLLLTGFALAMAKSDDLTIAQAKGGGVDTAGQTAQVLQSVEPAVQFSELENPLIVDYSLGKLTDDLQLAINTFLQNNVNQLNTSIREFTLTVHYEDNADTHYIRLFPTTVYISNWNVPYNDADVISLTAQLGSNNTWLIQFQESAWAENGQVSALGDPVYSFPWTGGHTWYKTQGYVNHATTLGYSLDFSPGSNTVLNVLSIEGGIFEPICYNSDPYQAMVKVTHDNGDKSGYLHLAKGSIPSSKFNTRIPKGQIVGSLYSGSVKSNPHPACTDLNNYKFATPCGCGYGTHLHFEVSKLINIQGTSLSSISSSAYYTPYTSNNTNLPIPAIPSGVDASDGTITDYVRVSWNVVTGATYYQIWRNTTNSSSGATKIYDDCCNPHHDTTAVNDVTYYYWVKACNANGCSGFSNSNSGYRTQNIVPETVTGVTVSDGTITDYVRVAYNNVSNATRYEIWRGTTNGLGNASKIFDDNGSPHHDSTAAFNVIYYYWVRACNAAGCAGFSNSDSGYRTQVAVPDAVVNVSGSDGYYMDLVRVSWASSSGATSYQVYRNTSDSLDGAFLLGSSPDTLYNDNTIINELTYWYFIKACNAAGCSTFSTSDDGYGSTFSDAYEPDNTPEQANLVVSGVPQTHSIELATDIDWLAFLITGNSAIRLETSGITNSDTRMWLYDQNLHELEFNDDDGIDLYSLIDRDCEINALPAGIYYVKVDEYQNNDEIANYQLNLVTNSCSTSSSINVNIGDSLMGNYVVQNGSNLRLNYEEVDSGPVKVESTNGHPIVAALRDLWWNGSVHTSSIQLMGLPESLLSDTYVFPSYNNVSLNDQLRFGNVGNADTVVTVTIGGQVMGSFPLSPNQRQKVNYAGLDSGPVIVHSSNGVPIIASIRDAWINNGVTSSFSQLMGLPQSLLSDTYIFPSYNNVSLSDQLRFGNVGNAPTTVTVTIGGVVMGNYNLQPNQREKATYPGLDSGPVIIHASNGVPIIASLREAWLNNGVTTSYFQMMGLPQSQLSDKYVFPAYDNVSLSGQLRFGNVGNAPTTVTVTIGGVMKGSYDLAPNQRQKVSYADLDDGPIVVQSSNGVPIIVALRDAWLVNGVTNSFSQLMGLPGGQLSSVYVFPSYNNVNYDNQLRIGVP